MNGTIATRSARLRPRIGYCRKHASARFRPLVPADPHRDWCFCTSELVGYDPTTTTASDGSIDRYYDPATHRFISTDPAPASNPYTYADNSPTNFIDPTGADAVESALLFQYDQAIANDFQALLNGIVNYLQTCASAELTPGANSSLACSQGFLSASIIYNEVQAADSTGLGLVVSNPFVALTVGSLFNGAAAAGQTALDQSMTGPLSLQPIVSSGVSGGGQTLQAGIFGALAGASGATSDPLKREAPTTADIVNFESSYFINAANSAGSAQSCYLTFTSGRTAC